MAESSFIQSYTSTLDALIQAEQKHNSQANAIDNSVVTLVGVTTVPDQPDWPDLPMVASELEKISKAVGSNRIRKLMDKDAKTSSVLTSIKASKWLHLACHGEQDHEQPLNSQLILYDGTLKLHEILAHDLPKAEFVFLSACQTAMGDAKLMNESMHLAGGFVAAGFQGAIGTLWNMSDFYGPLVAGMVYRKLFRGGKVPDASKAAEALHYAIQVCRDRKVSHVYWVPFIHIGV